MSGIERRVWTVRDASNTFSDDWRQIQKIMQEDPNWAKLEDSETPQLEGYSRYKRTERAKSNWERISPDTLLQKYDHFLKLFNKFLKLKQVPESIEMDGEKKLVRKKIEELTYMTWDKVKDLKGKVGSTEYFCCFGYTEDDSQELSISFEHATQKVAVNFTLESLNKIANVARKNFEKRLLIRKFNQRVTNHAANGLTILYKDVKEHLKAEALKEQMRVQEEMFNRILAEAIPRYLSAKKKKKPEKLSRLRRDTDSGSSTVSSVKSTDSPPPVETKKAESDTDSSPIPRYSPSPNESKPQGLHIDIELTTSTPEIRAERASVIEDPIDLFTLVAEEEEALESKADF